MKTKLAKTYVAMATLIKRESEIRAKLREQSEKLLRNSAGLSGRYTCSSLHSDGTVILSIPLAEMVEMFPEPETRLVSWTREDGSVQAYTRFGPHQIPQTQ